MTDSLRQRLAGALDAQYRITRELGGGGMSRTYVARDVALDRDVVIKILPPDLAQGISVERFLREVHTAAKLQHPHIVPVHASGEVDGLPWFTMPYVEGESLRERLRRSALPIDEVVSILRDVARALQYAHQRGIVHRDIKPDNVLLSSGTATVTDFGIAKAITASRTQADGRDDATLTQAGHSIGTPAYMSPEQASGDTQLDHRADLYAFGVMAWEMLAGERPFTDGPTARLLIAHLTEMPPDIRTRRPDVPDALADLVMQCLAKVPADRPRDAGEILDRMNPASDWRSGETTPRTSAAGGAQTPTNRAGRDDAKASRRRPLRAIAVGAVMLAAAFAGAGALGLFGGDTLIAEGAFGERESLIVADFRPPADDSLLGPTIAEALRADLSQSANLSVFSSATVREVLARMQKDRDALVLFPVAREIATREGARGVVDGEIVKVGTRYVLTARLVAAIDGTELATFREEASGDDDLLPAVSRLSRSIRERVGESLRDIRASKPLERVTTASLPALRRYVEGVRLQVEAADPERALRSLEEAVALDSTFAMAWRGIAVVLNNFGREPARANAALERAMQNRERLGDVERLSLEAYYYTRSEHADAQRAITTYEELLQRDPDNVSARNNIGVVFNDLREFERTAAVYRPALSSARPPSALMLDNMMELGVELRDSALIRQAVRLADSLYPDRATAGWVPALHMAEVREDWTGLRRLVDSLAGVRTLPATYRGGVLTSGALLSARAGRPQTAVDRLRQFYEMLAPTWSPARNRSRLDVLLDSLTLESFFFGSSPSARSELNRLIAPARLAAIPPADRPWFAVMRAAIYIGDSAAGARALRGIREEVVATSVSQPARWALRDSAAAALAAGQWDAATDLLQRAIAMRASASPDEAFELGMAHDRAGRADSAIVWFRTSATTVPDPFQDILFAPAAMKRLAELLEARGDIAEAVRWYEAFIDEWRDAEPRLQPVVESVRERVRVLRARLAPG